MRSIFEQSGDHEIQVNKDREESNEFNPIPVSHEREMTSIQIANYVPALPAKDIIVLNNVHKTYLLGLEGVPALRGVSLNVKEKEFICILGTSGGGKTTLLNIMGTIDKPTKGEVWICGTKIKSSTEDKLLASLRLNQLAFVFQTFNLLGSLTALENVELPMILKGGRSRGEIRKTAIELLEKVGLKERINHFPNMLSGGEQQRVTIARALSNNPRILLLDEPTGDLDTRNTDLVMDILVDLNVNEGITCVMVTHDVALKNYANRIIRMVDGKVNKIEDIQEEIRKSSIHNLKKNVAEYRNPVNNNPGESNALGVREGTSKHSGSGVTERRSPKDYAAIAYGTGTQLRE